MDTTTGAQKDPLYYLYDGLGSVVQLTDSTGKTADQYSFYEFGNQVAGGKQSPDATNVLHNNFGYTGEQWDSEAGLQYLRNRYYDPEVGRFINRDNVMGNAFAPLTQNLYAYVSNNPINFVDPSGHYRAGLTLGTEDWYDDIQYGGRWSANQISQLQQDLNRWGFRDNNGNTLSEDGVYGDSTRFAQRMYYRQRQQFLDNGHTMAEWDAMYPSGTGGSGQVQTQPENGNSNNPSATQCDKSLVDTLQSWKKVFSNIAIIAGHIAFVSALLPLGFTQGLSVVMGWISAIATGANIIIDGYLMYRNEESFEKGMKNIALNLLDVVAGKVAKPITRWKEGKELIYTVKLFVSHILDYVSYGLT